MGKGQKKALVQNLRDQIAGLKAYEGTLQQHLAIAKRDMQQAVAWAEKSEKEVERLRSVVVWYETTYGPQTELIDGSRCAPTDGIDK